MLHAVTKNKSRLYERYLGHREIGEKRVSEEDEITALIMGPLAFLPPYAIGLFWKALLKDVPSERFPDEAVTNAEMTFWPREKWTRIEPDLRVDLWWGGRKLTLLIEFKWRAPLSGCDQLHRQWNEFLSDEDRQRALHLFIAPDTSAAIAAKERDDIWDGRLVSHSWLDVLNVMQNGLSDPEHIALSRWRDEVISCFQKLSIRPLRGFAKIPLPHRLPEGGEVFWKGFNGFVKLAPPKSSQRIVSVSEPVFFKS
ncbi:MULTISPECIES: hypothetical protein [unclassified Pseudomonas]|uniref:hypothetical protein n=1 Tax=unclassified Pseudomonas TaxID=196821 RepID=UPI00128BBD99|nr:MULTISPECIES: hypothetical protein [unclassified Pseudomonas]MPQ71777.1 hypothetical protein [Pseudomonas sp. MWU12-2323]